MSMTKIRTIPALLLLLLAACAPLAGSSASPVPSGAPRSGGMLRIGQNAADLGSLDPHFGSGTQDRALVDMVFNGLLRFKPGDATSFEADLASTVPGPINDAEGHQTWTFVLRHGV